MTRPLHLLPVLFGEARFLEKIEEDMLILANPSAHSSVWGNPLADVPGSTAIQSSRSDSEPILKREFERTPGFLCFVGKIVQHFKEVAGQFGARAVDARLL